MNTLAANSSDYDAGVVTKQGFLALRDAETYDQASAISACSSCLAQLLRCLENGTSLQLYNPDGTTRTVADIESFRRWAQAHFPCSLDYLHRHGKDEQEQAPD